MYAIGAWGGCTPCSVGSYNSGSGNGVVCTNIASCSATAGYSGTPPNCICAAGYRFFFK